MKAHTGNNRSLTHQSFDNTDYTQVRVNQTMIYPTSKQQKQTTKKEDKSTYLYVWGSNKFGQLGIGEKHHGEFIEKPQKYKFPFKILHIACGQDHTVFLTNQGSVYSMGSNIEGQLGLGTRQIVQKNSPVLVEQLHENFIIQIQSGRAHNIALSRDGKCFSWGANEHGQLGLRDNPFANCEFNANSFVNIESSKHSITKISAGQNHSMFLDEKTGVLLGCGSNQQYQLGFIENQQEYRNVSQIPYQKQYGEFVDIKCGFDFTLALNKYGEVYATGNNSSSQCGLRGVSQIKQFTKIQTLQNIKSIETGIFSAAINQKGQLFIWGQTVLGQFQSPLDFTETNNIHQIRKVSIGMNIGIATDGDLILHQISEAQQDSQISRLIDYVNKNQKRYKPQNIFCGNDLIIGIINKKKSKNQSKSRLISGQNSKIIKLQEIKNQVSSPENMENDRNADQKQNVRQFSFSNNSTLIINNEDKRNEFKRDKLVQLYQQPLLPNYHPLRSSTPETFNKHNQIFDLKDKFYDLHDQTIQYSSKHYLDKDYAFLGKISTIAADNTTLDQSRSIDNIDQKQKDYQQNKRNQKDFVQDQRGRYQTISPDSTLDHHRDQPSLKQSNQRNMHAQKNDQHANVKLDNSKTFYQKDQQSLSKTYLLQINDLNIKNKDSKNEINQLKKILLDQQNLHDEKIRNITIFYEQAIRDEEQKRKNVIKQKKANIENVKKQLLIFTQKIESYEQIQNQQALNLETVTQQLNQKTLENENLFQQVQNQCDQLDIYKHKVDSLQQNLLKSQYLNQKIHQENQNIVHMLQDQENLKQNLLIQFQNLEQQILILESHQQESANLLMKKDQDIKQLQKRIIESQTILDQHENIVKDFNLQISDLEEKNMRLVQLIDRNAYNIAKDYQDRVQNVLNNNQSRSLERFNHPQRQMKENIPQENLHNLKNLKVMSPQNKQNQTYQNQPKPNEQAYKQTLIQGLNSKIQSPIGGSPQKFPKTSPDMNSKSDQFNNSIGNHNSIINEEHGSGLSKDQVIQLFNALSTNQQIKFGLQHLKPGSYKSP
eukprot:403343200